jgi:hypothetical protein
MQTKNQISITRKFLYATVMMAMFFSAYGRGKLTSASAKVAKNSSAPAPVIVDLTCFRKCDQVK